MLSAIGTVLKGLAVLAILVWVFGGEDEIAASAPDHVVLAESSVALAYARHARPYRCRVAAVDDGHHILCAVEGQSGGALYAVLPSQPGRSRIAPQTGKAMQHADAGFFSGAAVDLAPTRYDLDTTRILTAFE